MENNPVKKLSRAAAILSLTAVLASMPVSARVYADAYSTGAESGAEVENGPHAVVSISCEYGGDSVEASSSSVNATIEAVIDVENYRYGELRYSSASVWTRGESSAYDEYYAN